MDIEKTSKVGDQIGQFAKERIKENLPLLLNEVMTIMVWSLCDVISDVCDENGFAYDDVMAEVKKMIDVTMKGQGDE